MNARGGAGNGHSKEPFTTLGDLLHTEEPPPVPEQDWVRLVESIAAGDQHALRALYARTHGAVFTLVMRISNDRETAEELTVDVFHDLWRRAPQYDAENGSVLGWIMNQARSRAIDRLRSEQRKKRVAPNETQPQGPAAAPSPHDAVAARERQRVLRAALDELSPEERTAIETAFFSELSYAETAAKLEQPLGTVKTRVRSGLAKLRKALGVEGEGS